MNGRSKDQLHQRRPRILIVGAGVAGSSCAIRLSEHDAEVTLVDKEMFPREKVCGCCLGPAGVAAMESLSLRGWIEQQGVLLNRWTSSMAGRTVCVPLAGGLAIARTVLDTQLCETARRQGVNVRTECTVESLVQTGREVEVQLRSSGRMEAVAYDVVVVASGLTGLGSRSLPEWDQPPHGPFGIGWSAECEQAEAGVIYMACDDDGYVGLVRLADCRVDIAAALYSRASQHSRSSHSNSERASSESNRPLERAKAILRRSEFADWNFCNESAAMTTPPLRRRRQAGQGRLLLIGDAAGYVEPFTGEGMTWAIRSGIAAADLLRNPSNDLDEIGERWSKKAKSLLSGKKLSCSLLTAALRSSRVRQIAAFGLTRWPSLAKPLVSRL